MDLLWLLPFTVFAFLMWLLCMYAVNLISSPLRSLPGPYTWSPLGQLPALVNEEYMAPQWRWIDEFGGIFSYQLWFGGRYTCVANPDSIKHVLVTNCSNYRKPSFVRKYLAALIGDGLASKEGRDHALHRKIINPAFKHGSIKCMVHHLQRYSNVLVEVWSNSLSKCDTVVNAKQGVIIPVMDDLNKTALDVICKCAFDFDCNALTDENNIVAEAFVNLLSIVKRIWFTFIPLLRLLPTESKRKTDESIKLCRKLVQDVIKDKIENGNGKLDDDNIILLDILLSSYQIGSNNTEFKLSQDSLRDHIITIMFAGHETTSVSMTWTLYLLALHPEIQQRAREEIRSVVNVNDEMTWDVLENLVYLGNIVKESLRLYPPIPLTARETIQDDVICGYKIPKGTTILLIPPCRSKNYFPDPLAFNPDRWNSESTIHPYASLPFLAGPRTCIGYKFALMELKTILAVLLNNFSFAPVPGQTIRRKLALTMKPSPSLKLLVTKI